MTNIFFKIMYFLVLTVIKKTFKDIYQHTKYNLSTNKLQIMIIVKYNIKILIKFQIIN